MNHHPDIFLHSWNKVKITVSTHDKGGVTENDFQLAKKINEFIMSFTELKFWKSSKKQNHYLKVIFF